jgi:hypothetical protein
MIPRGIRNNNPGNLVITNIPWKGKVPKSKNTDGKFEQYDTMINGIRAMIMDVRGDIKEGTNTIATFLAEYAPQEENDLEAYIKIVCKETGFERNESLTPDKRTMCLLVKAISLHENGGHYITNEQIEKAWEAL